MASILIRTAITYLLLVFCMKLMGKRQIGELEINELVSTLLVSEIAAMPITEPDIPLLNAIIPILFIVSAEILIAYLKNKSKGVKKIIEGNPAYLVYKGKIKETALRDNRISINELLCEMRMQAIFDVKNVEYAILEQNGNISFLESSNKKTMAHYLLIDGDVDYALLSLFGLSEDELNGEISSRGLTRDEVLLFSIDDCRNINIIKKEEI